MKNANIVDAELPGEIEQFLDQHPEFTPIFSDRAILCGFRVGRYYLSLNNMEQLLPLPSESRTVLPFSGE